MLNKNFLRRGCLVIAGILFLIFLMQYNKIEKTELLSTEGRTFEKAVVTEVVSDNLTENGNRVGNQTVRLKLCSGKFKNEEVEAISSSSYLFGATWSVNHREKSLHLYIVLTVNFPYIL